MALDHQHFMAIALELSREADRQGNRPLGSLLVAAGRCRWRDTCPGGNEVYSEFDPTAHGEIVVIRKAARRLKSIDLSGCTLYTAMEPCPMCCWAILEAKASTLVLGERRMVEIGSRTAAPTARVL